MATDEQLIQQIREGKNEAYGQLFSKYYRQIYSVCLAILKNPDNAEEVANDTFVHAYLKLDQLSSLRTNLSSDSRFDIFSKPLFFQIPFKLIGFDGATSSCAKILFTNFSTSLIF